MDTSQTPPLHRIGPKIVCSAGSKDVLIGDLDGTGQTLIPSLVYELASQCRCFKPLPTHSREIWKKIPIFKKPFFMEKIMAAHFDLTGDIIVGPRMFEQMIQKILEKLTPSGVFITKSDMLNWARMAKDKDPEPQPIASVSTVTNNRLPCLKSWLESFIRNSQIHGREIDFCVFDDSPKPETRNEVRQLCHQTGRSFDGVVRYAGTEEKTVYVQALVKAGIPESVLNFAFFDPDALGYSYGANMNALLIDNAGDLVFNADDDTLCQLGKSPTYEDGIRAGTGQHPFRSRHYKNRTEVLKDIQFVQADLLDIHEKHLGKSLGTCLLESINSDQLDMEKMSPMLLGSLKMGEGHIVATLNGLVGDSGSNSPLPNLIPPDGYKDQLFQSEEIYRLAFESREVCKSVNKISIEPAGAMMPTFCGLDNRDILPPFFPNFRNSDSCFGELIRVCSHEALFAYEPWVLVHNPPEERVYKPQDLKIQSEEFWPEYVARLGLLSFSPGPGARHVQERLHLLGRHLMNIGSMPFIDYRYFFIEQDTIAKASRLSQYEALLEEHPKNPKYWKNHILNLLKDGKKRVTEKIVLAPYPFIEKYGQENGEKMVQTLLNRYGELMTWWPNIYEAAKVLKTKGIRLSQPTRGRGQI